MRSKQMKIGHYRGVWSWCIRDTSGRIVDADQCETPLPHASVGKVLLLIEVARQLDIGQLRGDQSIDRPTPVADSGLWQFLAFEAMRVDDACVLVASVSDNMATNALITKVGLDAVADMRRTYLADMESLELCDTVRDERGAQHPAELSVGSTSDWSALMHRLTADDVVNARVSARVRTWLSRNVDHSMVLDSLGLDPLVRNPDGIFNKTGWDTHVRADAGVVTRGGRHFAYSACVSPVDDGLAAMSLLRSIAGHMC